MREECELLVEPVQLPILCLQRQTIPLALFIYQQGKRHDTPVPRIHPDFAMRAFTRRGELLDELVERLEQDGNLECKHANCYRQHQAYGLPSRAIHRSTYLRLRRAETMQRSATDTAQNNASEAKSPQLIS